MISFRCVWILLLAVLLPFFGMDARAEPQKIYVLSGQKISNYLDQTPGKKRVLMIYASWCPACRSAMPFMMQIEQTEPGSVVAVSRDKSMKDLSVYMKKFDFVPFKIIMADENEPENAMERSLAKFGIKPWKSIPTYVMLDEDNNVVDQGNFGGQEVLDFLLGKYKPQ